MNFSILHFFLISTLALTSMKKNRLTNGRGNRAQLLGLCLIQYQIRYKMLVKILHMNMRKIEKMKLVTFYGNSVISFFNTNKGGYLKRRIEAGINLANSINCQIASDYIAIILSLIFFKN